MQVRFLNPYSYKISVCLLACMLVSGAAYSQLRQGNLTEIDQDYREYRVGADARIQTYLRRNPQARFTYVENQAVHLLVDVNENGIPIYIKSDNAVVATSLNVHQLRTGGSLGLNLDRKSTRLNSSHQ